MNRFYIINKSDKQSIDIKEKMTKILIDNNFIEDKNKPELCISVGGDGTMLKAIHHFENILDTVSFVGVHTGTLGFYTDFIVEEVDLLLESIIKDEYEDISYRMLDVVINHESGHDTFHVINEARIENNLKTQVLNIKINKDHFETFRGNGLNFSTASGSTGYNKSLGGPILHPKTNSYVLTEIAAINNIAYRTIGSPLVLTEKHITEITFTESEGIILGCDSTTIKLCDKYKNIKSIEFKLSRKNVNFIRYRKLNFLDRVSKNFIK
ncbi:NAD kinase [Mycoplasma sp. P36-A1]|uniref:NAD kinase n=1 Tax=Mycoplasma sp. P36-A1 TaxID=3252900 RepID=UPI003C2B619E